MLYSVGFLNRGGGKTLGRISGIDPGLLEEEPTEFMLWTRIHPPRRPYGWGLSLRVAVSTSYRVHGPASPLNAPSDSADLFGGRPTSCTTPLADHPVSFG